MIKRVSINEVLKGNEKVILTIQVPLEASEIENYFEAALFGYMWDVKNSQWKEGQQYSISRDFNIKDIFNLTNEAILYFGLDQLMHLKSAIPDEVKFKASYILNNIPFEADTAEDN